MDKLKNLDDILNDYGFLEIIPEDDDKEYGDCTDPDQVKGFFDARLEDEE